VVGHKGRASRRGGLVQTLLVHAGTRHATTATNRGSDSAASGWRPTGEERSEAASPVHAEGPIRRGIPRGVHASRSGENRAALPRRGVGEAAAIGGERNGLTRGSHMAVRQE
jgi:hypothetical protein